jgi:predicted NACHT family NTPase
MPKTLIRLTDAGIKTLEDSRAALGCTKEQFSGFCKISKTCFTDMLQGRSVTAEIRVSVEIFLRQEERLGIKKLGDKEFLGYEVVFSSNFSEIYTQLNSEIAERCGKMRVLGMMEHVATSEVFVDLDICSEKNKQRLHLDSLADELVKLESEDQPHSLRLIISGSAGTGKTMLLRNLALSCFDIDSALHQNKRIPIYIRLREYATRNLASELENYIVDEYDIGSDDFKELSKAGKLLILLDGLDSVEIDEKQLIYDRINKLVTKFPDNDYLISCRFEKYIFESFERVHLCPIDDIKQISDFIQKRIKVNSPYLTTDQKDKLIEQIGNKENGLSEIAKNPLLLVLICLTYAKKDLEGLSTDKWDLVRESISIELEEWDLEQHIDYETATNFSKTDKENFLSFVAFRTIQDGKTLLSEETVKEFTSQYINDIWPEDSNLNLEQIYGVQNVLNSLDLNHSLLFRKKDQRYEFPTSIFRDYFTLKFIRSKYKTLENFKSGKIFRDDKTKWETFLENTGNAYSVLFGDV